MAECVGCEKEKILTTDFTDLRIVEKGKMKSFDHGFYGFTDCRKGEDEEF